MDRAPDAWSVAVAALRHYALVRPIPDTSAWLGAERYADAVLAALWRRGMLIDDGCQ